MVRFAVLVLVILIFSLIGCGAHHEDARVGDVPGTKQQDSNGGPDVEMPTSAVAAFDCEDGSYLVAEFRRDGSDVVLFLPEETVFLPHAEGASGAKYAGEGVTFWDKGHEAMLERDGVAVNCVKNGPASVIERAKLGGADFWATGNEPGWSLELFSDHLVLVTNYGELRIEAPVGPPVLDGVEQTAVFRTNGGEHDVTATLRGVRCADDMSGQEFETTVELVLDGRAFHGCGQALH